MKPVRSVPGIVDRRDPIWASKTEPYDTSVSNCCKQYLPGYSLFSLNFTAVCPRASFARGSLRVKLGGLVDRILRDLRVTVQNCNYGISASASAGKESASRKAKTNEESGAARGASVRIQPRGRSVRGAGIKTGAGSSFGCGRAFRTRGQDSSGRRLASGRVRWL